MPNIIRTLSQLLAMFPDNVDRNIHPQDDRDFIVTATGVLRGTDPTPLNDRIDSAGIGAYCDLGSTWWNYVTGTLWKCNDGNPTLAIWIQINAAGPIPSPWFYARLTTGGLLTPTLKRTGIHVQWGSATSIVHVVNLADYQQIALGEFFSVPGVGGPQGFVTGLDDLLQNIEVDYFFTVVGDTNADFGPVTYGFEQWAPLTTSGQLQVLPGGITGDATINPACNIGLVPIFNAGQIVLMRFRGVFDGADVYEFDQLPDPTRSLAIGSPNQPSPVTITYAGNTTNSTTVSFNANVFLFFITANINLTAPWPTSQGGTGSTGFSPSQVVVTDVVGNLTTVGGMGDGQLVIGASGGAPGVGSIGSSDASITVTNSANHIDLKVAGGGGGPTFSTGRQTFTSASGYAAILNATATHVLQGGFNMKLTSVNWVDVRITTTDWNAGAPVTFTTTMNTTGGSFGWQNFTSPPVTGGRVPLWSYLVEIKDNNPGFHGTIDLIWGYFSQ